MCFFVSFLLFLFLVFIKLILFEEANFPIPVTLLMSKICARIYYWLNSVNKIYFTDCIKININEECQNICLDYTILWPWEVDRPKTRHYMFRSCQYVVREKDVQIQLGREEEEWRRAQGNIQAERPDGINRKRNSLFEHMLADNNFTKNILEVKIMWKEKRGRSRMSILGEII